MPTGPGDEILDAIEAGEADDAVMKKYHVDDKQLKAFKSLHYGLSNQKMGYNEINDYYPELKSYFQGGGAPAQAQPQQPAMERPDFTKPVHEKQTTESTAAPAGQQHFKQLAESGKAGETLQQKFNKKSYDSHKTINKALSEHDDVLQSIIRQGRYDQAKEQALTNYANTPRTDMPAAAALAGVRQQYLEPGTKPQDLPVTPEDLAQKRNDIQTDEAQARDFINKVVVKKPEHAAELQTSMYMMDAAQRMKDNPNIGLKVNDNLHKLEKGELQYNAATGQLQRPLGVIDALISGVRERTRQMNNYDLFQGNDADVIKLLEKRRSEFDPDAPVDIPKGFGEIAQMTGMEWASLLEGAAINTVGAVASGVTGGASEAVAPYLSAAVTAPEYYKRSYSTALEESYSELRNKGKSPEEALKLAREQARTEGKLGAAEGFVSSFVGGRIGLKELPKFNITGGFKNAVKGLLKESAHFAGETSLEGLADGLVAGALQERKDAAAIEKGMSRDSEQNIKDNVIGELTFSLALGAMTKAGKTLTNPETYKKIRYWMGTQDPKVVNEQLGNAVMHGEISEEDANNITEELKQQQAIDAKIPKDIKDVSRMAMHDKIDQRNKLEEEIANTDEALHPEKKEQIKELNNEIAEHAKHKKTTTDESETEAKTQAEAEGLNVGPEGQTEQVTAPVEEGAADKIKGSGEAAPAGASSEMRYTNPAGTEYVLRDDRLYHVNKDGIETAFSDKAMETKNAKELVETIKQANQQTEQNAVQEQSPEGLPVHTPPGDSQAVEQGNESQGAIPEGATTTQQQEEVAPINTEEDLDRELQKVMQNKTTQPVEDKSAPLPKLAEGQEKAANAPVSKDIKSYTPTSIIQKAKEMYAGNPLIERVVKFLEPLIAANPNIKINYDAKVPGNVYGFSYKDGSVDLNFNNHPNEGALIVTALHEFMHAVTRNEIENNSAFRSELDQALGKVRKQMGLPDTDEGATMLMHYLSAAGKLDESQYGAANPHELIAELFTNKAFRDKLAGIDYEGDSLLRKLFLIVAKYLSEAYNKLAGAKAEIKAENLADFLMDLTEKTISGKQGEDTAGSLASKAPQSQEDAIRSIIEKTPKSISDEKLKERIVSATGMDEKAVQDLIDDVRKPVVPPPHGTKIEDLSEQSKQASLKKFDKALKQPKPKEQSWLSKQLQAIRNGSAWIDNPYRFITKIVEDINRRYKLPNKEVIPLGRQFEKSAVGRAALKVQSFISDIIQGNINGENLGRLKGEKYDDFQKYLMAKRVMDRLNKQEEKRKAGEEVNRQTGNITYQDAEVQISALKSKYGDIDDFVKRGQAFQEHMDTMLKTLMAGGILSQDQYDKIKADNDFYAPFAVVQAKLFAEQDKHPVGISGIVKRIKGIDYKLPKTTNEALGVINDLGKALNENLINPEEYFNSSMQVLNDALHQGLIDQQEFDRHIASLENPGFAINDILDAAANMIYKSEGLALRNTMLQRLYAYKAADKDGLFIQDVDGFTPMTLPDGTTRMVPKPLSSIKVEPGMAAIKLKVDGQDKIVAVNKHAADKLTQMSNYETATILKVADFANRLFRAAVITLSPGFQLRNFLIDFTRTAMLSRYGLITGKGLVQPLVNAALFAPQYTEALLHSALGNLGKKTETYKAWMKSDSFSKGMFDNLFDNEKRIKEISTPTAMRLLKDFFKFHWIDVPGSILEQSHKILVHQRGQSVEGFKPEMFTAMMGAIVNRNLNPSMSTNEMKDAIDKINYEVQNMAGSPNFPQTHRWMKLASMYLQFFSARVKGEVTDYRRVANIFTTYGEGVKLSATERRNMMLQFFSVGGMIAAYAIRNNWDDDDEKEFDGIPSFHQDNYINIPLGYFEYENDKGEKQTLRDYAKVPLRGLTATMNVMANSFVKFYKRENPEEFKKMALAFAGNASPINLNGKTEREMGESVASNLTPVFKYFIEYSFNRDTHNHRDLIPDYVQGKGMLSKYQKGEIKPWDVATKKTPQWAKDFSKYLFDTLGISVSAIEIDHMENTMGNPTELYDKALKKSVFRSEQKYPLYEPKDSKPKNTSSTTKTPIP